MAIQNIFITGPINYGYRVVDERARYQGTDEYYCVKKGGSNDPLIHYGFYTMLKRISENGKEEVEFRDIDTLIRKKKEIKENTKALKNFMLV